MGVFTSVDCRIDGNGPHGSGITVAIAIVVFSAISGGPYVNVTKAFASLKMGFSNFKNAFGLHNNLRRPYYYVVLLNECSAFRRICILVSVVACGKA